MAGRDSALVPDRIVPETTKTHYYPALDGMRTIAIALVFLVHLLPEAVPFGWFGVYIFFVLSGFLITGILFDSRETAHRYKNFYARRALRIFPLYYGVLLLLTVAKWTTHGTAPPFFWLWFVYLQNYFWTATHGMALDFLVSGGGHAFAAIGHFWTLAIEEQFYLLWPPIVFLVRSRRRLMQVCVACVVARVLLTIYLQAHSPQVFQDGGVLYRTLPTQCDGFLVGGLLALWLRGKPSPKVIDYAGLMAGAAILLFSGLLTLLRFEPGWIGGGDAFSALSGFQNTIGITLLSLVSAIFLLAVTQPGSWAYRCCNLAPMRSLGRVSYGLYVYHLPLFVITGGRLLRLFGKHSAGDLAVIHAVLTVVATVLVSYISFDLYEKRFLLLKNRFTSIQGAREKQVAAHPL